MSMADHLLDLTFLEACHENCVFPAGISRPRSLSEYRVERHFRGYWNP